MQPSRTSNAASSSQFAAGFTTYVKKMNESFAFARQGDSTTLNDLTLVGMKGIVDNTSVQFAATSNAIRVERVMTVKDPELESKSCFA